MNGKFRVWDGEEMHEPPHDFQIRSNGSLYIPIHFRMRTGRSHVKDEYEVMFYTGLTDAEGAETYQSDIVDVVFQSDGDSRGVVTWDDEKGRWQIEYGGYQSYTNPLGCPSRKHKPRIIGNLYENPELLKEATART